MKCKTMLAVIACLSVSFSAGCNKEKISPSSKVVQKSQKSEKAATPKDALKNMGKAIRDGDKDAFVACFDATEDQKKVLGVLCETVPATRKFEEAMVKEYGENAVRKSGSKNNIDDFKDDQWLEYIEIKIDGDKATATKKGMKEAMNLVKKDGGWKIAAGNMAGEKQTENIDKVLKMFEARIQATKNAMGKIGKEGYTAEKIYRERDTEMMKAMESVMQEKP